MPAPTVPSAATDRSDASVTPADATLQACRERIRAQYGRDESAVVRELLQQRPLSENERGAVRVEAIDLVEELRREGAPTMMESFLGEYGLSTQEGVGLMCLAEALLRVPDADTIDELIADKLDDADWAGHLGHSSSPLVNASTWALMLTGRLLDDGDNPIGTVRPLLRRVGEPVVRRAVAQAMRLLGKQFVLGRDIDEAVKEARALEKKGYTHSYDMLGEAARTDADARRYQTSYADAIARLAKVGGASVAERPGISVKLSALHPRYEHTHREQVMAELLPRARELAIAAARAGIGFNVDAEEADRLELSLDLIEALLGTPELAGWDGFGVVVQAYGRRALPVIDWLVALATREQRRLMVRLVKGAYWDTEIKEAQTLGVASFPVFTRKASTDLSFLVCARRLLDHRDVLYPQFATHNAHTVVAIRQMAGDDPSGYEFQRLHGMGEALHDSLRRRHGTRCRIYAPVGAHRDLLAYLVRRLLENGANSSFVNQIVDTSVPAEQVASDPISVVEAQPDALHPAIRHPRDVYAPLRGNSRGFRLNDPASVDPLLTARAEFKDATWTAAPMIVGEPSGGETLTRTSPQDSSRTIGSVTQASEADVQAALDAACDPHVHQESWASLPAAGRAAVLRRAADLYEDHAAELIALDALEAGKTLADGISEVREAVDFLRYYAAEAERIADDDEPPVARGVIACISPWNFPLAIFTGQIAGALAAGNRVLAKPAEQTPLIAARGTELLLAAGVPATALQLLPGDGQVGALLSADPRIDGICFTGSTETARRIERSLAGRDERAVKDGATADPMLIAETGGLNAMIVDSTALTEQVVRDVIVSSFQSAGQRCSALRMLYIQEEAEQRTLEMLCGALDALVIGDPWPLSCDVGPVIDAEAKAGIEEWVETQRQAGRIVHEGKAPAKGHFVAPVIIKVAGIEDLEREVFGPVLHVATYRSSDLDKVVDSINARGYGLTFGLHTRIDDRVQRVLQNIHTGNAYVNRNQIGAVVASQPFGGEGLSGTGPKAGGPQYVRRFLRVRPASDEARATAAADRPTVAGSTDQMLDTATLQQALDALAEPGMVERGHGLAAGGRSLPGPTGESNRTSVYPRGNVLVVAKQTAGALRHVRDARAAGCSVLVTCADQPMRDAIGQEWQGDERVQTLSGRVEADSLTELRALAVVAIADNDPVVVLAARRALAARQGAILPLVSTSGDVSRYVLERHVCIDTTAAGGNASLLAATG